MPPCKDGVENQFHAGCRDEVGCGRVEPTCGRLQYWIGNAYFFGLVYFVYLVYSTRTTCTTVTRWEVYDTYE